jgi:hypothetical protein
VVKITTFWKWVITVVVGVGLGFLCFRYNLLPKDPIYRRDILYVLSDITGAVILLYSQLHNNKKNQSELLRLLKALDKHEVIFWGPGLFIISSLAVLSLIVGLFLPWGYKEGVMISLYQLYLVYPSMWLILLAIPIPFLIYAIIIKSFLKTLIFLDLMMLPLLFTVNFYQKITQKPYLLGSELYDYTWLVLLIIFIFGFIFVFNYWKQKEYWKTEQKLSKY